MTVALTGTDVRGYPANVTLLSGDDGSKYAQRFGDLRDSRIGGPWYSSRADLIVVKIGAGYSFTDFSDDLTDLSYRSRGPFLNVLGTLLSADLNAAAPLEKKIPTVMKRDSGVARATGYTRIRPAISLNRRARTQHFHPSARRPPRR